MANGTISETILSTQFFRDHVSAKERLLICGIGRDIKITSVANRYVKNESRLRQFFNRKNRIAI